MPPNQYILINEIEKKKKKKSTLHNWDIILWKLFLLTYTCECWVMFCWWVMKSFRQIMIVVKKRNRIRQDKIEWDLKCQSASHRVFFSGNFCCTFKTYLQLNGMQVNFSPWLKVKISLKNTALGSGLSVAQLRGGWSMELRSRKHVYQTLK